MDINMHKKIFSLIIIFGLFSFEIKSDLLKAKKEKAVAINKIYSPRKSIPDIYENSNQGSGCLCDSYINNPDLCENDNLIYNSSGTELNGEHDSGEEFPSAYDYGEDGLFDIDEE